MTPGRFDVFLFADYSGARDASDQRRAIALWRLAAGGQPRKIDGPFTRSGLRETVLDELRQATRRRERVLFGIDHQWSWPRDLWRAAGLDGVPWREAVSRLVRGDGGRPPLGPPATFAAAFNAFADAPIFYSRVKHLARSYGLPRRSRWDGDPVRLTERAMPGAKPATRLGGAGAVAGQTLHGLAELHQLLLGAAARGIDVLAWPMDALGDDGRSHVGVEVYPSFCRPRHIRKTDDADARACCSWAAQADLRRALDLTDAPADVRHAARIEGWILGADPDRLSQTPEPSQVRRGVPRGAGRRLARVTAPRPNRSVT